VLFRSDIIVSADQYESSRGLYRGPVLFSKQFGATGVNGAPDRRELVLARDYTHSLVYFGSHFSVFNPVDGPPVVFQIGQYGTGPAGERVMLQVFAFSSDASSTYPLYRTLRRIRAYPITITVQVAVTDPTTVLRLLATPTNAWVVLDDQVAKTWSIYRFDRATDELVFEYTMPWPIDPAGHTIESEVITDDGTIYVHATNQAAGTHRIVRITDGTATDIWDDAIAKSQPPRFTGGLYSTGARIYAALHEIVTDEVNGLSRPRFTVITPSIPAVVAAPTPELPPSFVPPAPCNPLTNVPCVAGETCDVGPSTNGFACAPSGTATLCGACDPVVGPFCGPGHVCILNTATSSDPKAGQCVKTCCDASDCGPAACVVEANRFDFPVGYCAAFGPVVTPLCSAANIPVVPPSGGACSN